MTRDRPGAAPARVERLGFLLLLLAGLSAPAVAGGDDRLVTLEGQLTAEGVECPALRAADGKLYSLLGDLDGFGPGASVCLRGRAGGVSFCMRGTPFTVEAIASSCAGLDRQGS